MKIFLDTANLEEIRRAKELGVLDGVTTNPTLLSRERRPWRELVEEICRTVEGPVSLEAVSREATAIVEEARQLAAIHPNVVVKVPLDREGLRAMRRLAEEGIRVNATLVFSPLQGLLAAKAGASYISPFVGRLDDVSHDGMQLVEQLLSLLDNYGFEAEVIVASVRHPLHVLRAALLGADIVTVPWRVLEQMLQHPLTDVGIERFLQDWQRVR